MHACMCVCLFVLTCHVCSFTGVMKHKPKSQRNVCDHRFLEWTYCAVIDTEEEAVTVYGSQIQHVYAPHSWSY